MPSQKQVDLAQARLFPQKGDHMFAVEQHLEGQPAQSYTCSVAHAVELNMHGMTFQTIDGKPVHGWIRFENLETGGVSWIRV